ncbi:hypothetical protein [Actinokineospora bangkokensis]|uniref:Uncharacterized protein n=1 Tax=Actinokineospora bangkokensis TaxID=1193682 RepID=A0A1Q9LDW2_9PSEU|nr:hypothetical protein [Actinokineospora bangkokensis]OLR90195.1 hypothetical protein BJP25_04350 [Actinokineospora bangkokensis]
MLVVHAPTEADAAALAGFLRKRRGVRVEVEGLAVRVTARREDRAAAALDAALPDFPWAQYEDGQAPARGVPDPTWPEEDRTPTGSDPDTGYGGYAVPAYGGYAELGNQGGYAVAGPRSGYGPPPALRRDHPGEVEVSVYLDSAEGHERVEAAVEGFLAHYGARVSSREDPVLGSWFRRMGARLRVAAGSELGLEARLALEQKLQQQNAANAAALMQNLGPLLTAIQAQREAVIRLGPVLVVKVEDQVVVHQLTTQQQLALDHRPGLLKAPRDVLAAITDPAPVPELERPAPPVIGG